MDGAPVWLASLSRRSLLTNRFIPTGRWSPRLREESIRLLRDALDGRGDPGRERVFRMNVTLCLHRALSARDLEQLGTPFDPSLSTDLAGGPVEVLWESVPGRASTRPCASPRRHFLDPREPELWLPLDCGTCASCRARAQVSGPEHHQSNAGGLS